MKKLFIICSLLTTFSLSAQHSDSLLFNRVMHDPLKAFSGYPEQPEIPQALLADIFDELGRDSARYYFCCLSRDSLIKSRAPNEPLDWLFNHRCHHLLLACLSHWNPDTRIIATRKLYEWKMIRPLICTTKEQYEVILKKDQRILSHLIYIFESNPTGIPGSENSTIHHIYMIELLRSIDLYSGENLLRDSKPDEFLRNSQELAKAMIIWKSHSK